MLEKLFSRDHRLPLNRKEAFYSATVLPGIICSDGLVGFFKLLGKPNIHLDLNPDTTNVQVFSEYDLRDAIRGDQTASESWEKLLELGMTGETPDLVILVELRLPLLVIVEAKLFDKSAEDIADQIKRQRVNMALLRQVMPEYETLHVALVLESAVAEVRAKAGEPEEFKTITWEDIVTSYEEVRYAAYWVRLLKFALHCEPHLRAVDGSGRTHEDGRMTAAEILSAYDGPDCVVRSVGCLGSNWNLLKEDIVSTGGTRKWAVSYKNDLPSRYYLPIKDFVETVRSWMRSALPFDVASRELKKSPIEDG